jgi:hypothetical protein
MTTEKSIFAYMRNRFLIVVFFITIRLASAQSSYVPLGSYSIYILDRMEIKQGRLSMPVEFNTTAKAYKRQNIARYADSFDIAANNLSKQDIFNLNYLRNDNFEYSNSPDTKTKKSFWGTGLYKHKAAFYDVDVPELRLIVNPVAYLKLEYDNARKGLTYINNRGIEIRGNVGSHISFYTQCSDEIQRLNTWNQQYKNQYEVVPGTSFLQNVQTSTGDTTLFNYWMASGYVAFQAGKVFDLQFGHGRNFLGNGYRSMILSDFSPDNLYLRLNTRVWRINYTNIWGEMYDFVPFISRSSTIKRHYFATTHASINITKRLNIGLVQSVSFQRDSGHASRGYDLQYLNPIIFYKPVENSLNSPDKAIVGMDFKYNFARHVSLYGQFMISEIKTEELFSGRGWWGNKQAIQLGAKYIDIFNVSNLDLQVEMNQAAPYMYTSFDSKNAYVNFNQNMAHPTGANFREFIGIVRYQPFDKLFITAKGIYNTYGNDTNGSNWGKDIRLSYNSRMQEFGNYIGQGVKTHLYIGELTLSYMFWHNVFVDLQLTYRKTKSRDAPGLFNSETFNGAIALRWNIAPRYCDY